MVNSQYLPFPELRRFSKCLTVHQEHLLWPNFGLGVCSNFGQWFRIHCHCPRLRLIHLSLTPCNPGVMGADHINSLT